ncbi:MAG: sn-glycerol-3-phosphate ABC transporter ATP-binding protein UgpC [Alphaproteobacteria bacterium]|nr:sn-glycerol-3-phosphate ABC transporter ATP-binding protein UgpC [Alphaproteobacteria bacterium]
MATLDLVGVRKSFGATDVIHGIDLSVVHGEFCVFVGPSGCGKSTLLRMIAGLESVSAGELRIDGARVNELGASERGLAMVFQSYALYPHMSVRQNLSFGLENIRVAREEIDRRVAEAARMLRLEPYLDRRPGALSGGQRQRVAIGRAVVREPKIFLFDEPLSNLDAELRVRMRAELGALHDRLGNTMIYVTHDQVEAMTLADRIAVLRDGRCEQFDRPLELYNAPANMFVAGFIGSPRMNFMPAKVAARDGAAATLTLAAGGRVRVEAVTGSAAEGADVTFGVRPEHVKLVEAGAGDADMHVNLTEQLGGESYVYGTIGDGHEVTARLPGQTRVRGGETVGMALSKSTATYLFGKDGRALKRGAANA